MKNGGLPDLFKGPRAPFPLEDISLFLRSPEYVCLFCEDIAQPSDRLLRILDRLSMRQREQTMASYFGKHAELLRFRSGQHLNAQLTSSNGWATYSSDYYFEIGHGEAFGYSSARDNLAAIAVSRALLKDPNEEIERWDQAFCRYLREVGIGFGDEGQAYARSLLMQLPEPRSTMLLASVPAP